MSPEDDLDFSSISKTPFSCKRSEVRGLYLVEPEPDIPAHVELFTPLGLVVLWPEHEHGWRALYENCRALVYGGDFGWHQVARRLHDCERELARLTVTPGYRDALVDHLLRKPPEAFPLPKGWGPFKNDSPTFVYGIRNGVNEVFVDHEGFHLLGYEDRDACLHVLLEARRLEAIKALRLPPGETVA